MPANKRLNFGIDSFRVTKHGTYYFDFEFVKACRFFYFNKKRVIFYRVPFLYYFGRTNVANSKPLRTNASYNEKCRIHPVNVVWRSTFWIKRWTCKSLARRIFSSQLRTRAWRIKYNVGSLNHPRKEKFYDLFTQYVRVGCNTKLSGLQKYLMLWIIKKIEKRTCSINSAIPNVRTYVH